MATYIRVEQMSLKRHFGHLLENKLDIRKLVGSAQNLLVLAQPLFDAAEILHKIRRWEYFWATGTILLVCNVICILLPALYSTLAIFVALSGLVGVGLLHRKHRILVKAFPTPLREEDYDKQDHHECIQEFHLLLVVTEESINRCTNLVLKLYSILKLDDWNISLKCYAVMFLVVLFLFLFPLRIVMAIFVDLILLYHPLQRRLQVATEPAATDSSVKDALAFTPSAAPPNLKGATQSDDAISQSSDVQADPGFGTDSEGSEKLPDESSSGDEIAEVSSVVGEAALQRTEGKSELNPKAPSVVGRLLELKKRRPNTKERCTGCMRCGVMFNAILKRRHICSHCGNHFCSRCCSHKVPRSMFGATAPAAQTETVAVCLSCYTFLTGTIREKTS